MELLLSREQKSGMMGGLKFILTAKVKLTPEEQEDVEQYKMENLLLGGDTDIKVSQSAVATLTGNTEHFRITARELVRGKTVECKDIIDIMSAESQIRDAAKRFHALLTAAAGFQGEEVVTFA